jgi:peroxiredoxin family protein
MCLSSQISDDDPEIISEATHALSQIARWLDGAQAVVDTKAVDHIPELLETQSSNVQCRTCQLVARLVGYETTAPAILALEPYKRLVSFLE